MAGGSTFTVNVANGSRHLVERRNHGWHAEPRHRRPQRDEGSNNVIEITVDVELTGPLSPLSTR